MCLFSYGELELDYLHVYYSVVYLAYSVSQYYSLVHVVDVLHHLYDGKHLFLYQPNVWGVFKHVCVLLGFM